MGDDEVTMLPDVNQVPLLDLLADPLADDEARLTQQVEHPRFNIGSGPPGRVD